MQHAHFVHGVQTVQDLEREVDRLFDAQETGALDECLQGPIAQQFHHEIGAVAEQAHRVNECAVGMMDRPRQASLQLKPHTRLGVQIPLRSDHLDGDRPTAPAIDAAMNPPHRTAPDLLTDGERTEFRAWANQRRGDLIESGSVLRPFALQVAQASHRAIMRPLDRVEDEVPKRLWHRL